MCLHLPLEHKLNPCYTGWSLTFLVEMSTQVSYRFCLIIMECTLKLVYLTGMRIPCDCFANLVADLPHNICSSVAKIFNCVSKVFNKFKNFM